MKRTTTPPLLAARPFGISRNLHAALAQGSGDGAIIVFNTRAPLILQGVSSGLQRDMAGWGEAYRVRDVDAQSLRRAHGAADDDEWGRGERACPNAIQLRLLCRSELAREELTGAAFIQDTRVIVDVFREQELGVPLAPTEGDVRLTERH